MKRFLVLLPLGLLLAVQTAHAKTVRVFVIGNSFSGNSTKFLPQIVKDRGDELVIGRAELGGHSLQQHWSYVEAAEANPEDPKGHPYANKTKSLRDLLSAGTWDYVTIQQYSLLSSDANTYQPYARKLTEFIKKLQPQAEIVVHQTWAYRSDAKTFGKVAEKQSAKDQREMYEKSRAAYHTLAKDLGLRIIPVGDAFRKVTTDPQREYKKDAKFDWANPSASYPTLPDQTNSLNVGYSWKKADTPEGKPTLNFDANHANDAGCYLGGLVWYGFFFGGSPEKVTYAPPKVSAEFAAQLRKVAAQTLQETSAAQAKP